MILNRLAHFFKRHGPGETLHRLLLELKRLVAGNRMILYQCDLQAYKPNTLDGAGPVRVERKNLQKQIEPADLDKLLAHWNPEIARAQIAERFARGASLWLCKFENQLAGYGWTLIGSTMEPHFFPLGPNDAHLFDFFVFPEFRGRKINPWLVGEILKTLATENRSRAFIEAAEWNAPQFSSLRKTPFQKFGSAAKHQLFGRTIVTWKN